MGRTVDLREQMETATNDREEWKTSFQAVFHIWLGKDVMECVLRGIRRIPGLPGKDVSPGPKADRGAEGPMGDSGGRECELLKTEIRDLQEQPRGLKATVSKIQNAWFFKNGSSAVKKHSKPMALKVTLRPQKPHVLKLVACLLLQGVLQRTAPYNK
ncbi:unnamed protein product [Natator depressus]